MSHYRVLVIAKDKYEVEDLMAPYDENMEVAPYVDEGRILDEEIEWYKKNYEDLADAADEEIVEIMKDDGIIVQGGKIYSTYNPNSRWDYWMPLEPYDGDRAEDFPENYTTYAVVTPDGVWNAPGEVGWFGMSTETKEQWDKWREDYHKEFVKPYENTDYRMFVVDCHI